LTLLLVSIYIAGMIIIKSGITSLSPGILLNIFIKSNKKLAASEIINAAIKLLSVVITEFMFYNTPIFYF